MNGLSFRPKEAPRGVGMLLPRSGKYGEDSWWRVWLTGDDAGWDAVGWSGWGKDEWGWDI